VFAHLAPMSVVDRTVIILTVLGVAVSGFANWRASRVTSGWLKVIFRSMLALSLFYIPAYAARLTDWLLPGAWSSFMLGFGLVVWWGPPWMWFAWLVLREHKKAEDILKGGED